MTKPMADDELAKFIGIDDDARWPQAIARLPPGRRAVLEKMAELSARLERHLYVPSAMHMGDCAICGHIQAASIHIRRSDDPKRA